MTSAIIPPLILSLRRWVIRRRRIRRSHWIPKTAGFNSGGIYPGGRDLQGELGNLNGPDQTAAIGEVRRIVEVGFDFFQPFAQFGHGGERKVRCEGQDLPAPPAIDIPEARIPNKARCPPRESGAFPGTEWREKPGRKAFLNSKTLNSSPGFLDIDQVIWNVAVFTQVLSGADVHPAENLAGVGGKDLSSKRSGDLNANPGFARGRGAENDDEIEGIHFSSIIREKGNWGQGRLLKKLNDQEDIQSFFRNCRMIPQRAIRINPFAAK